ncbi:MAG: hypothetical protein IKO65_02420 [Victivallales bacterium]|nr:hypothetical protein [Victivallales bacterium]
MKKVIAIIILTVFGFAFAGENLVEKIPPTDGDFSVRILTTNDEHQLPYDKSFTMVVELDFPSDASYQPFVLNFDDIPCFDCDEKPKEESKPTTEGRKTARFSYQLEPLQPPFEIPAITVTFKDGQGNDVTVTTEPFKMNIAKPTPSEELEDDFLEPLTPPGMERKDLMRLLAWCGGALLVLLLVAGGLWRTLRKHHLVVTPPLTPYEIAQRDLEALLAEKLPEAGEYKRFYERISGILREYLENRFDVKAPRLTTEEFLQLLTTTPELVREHRDLLQKFLSACDLVKFAGEVPDSPEIAQITTACRTFLDTTQPPPPPDGQP